MSFSGRDRLCSPSDGTDTLKVSGPRASAIVCVCARLASVAGQPKGDLPFLCTLEILCIETFVEHI